MAFLPKPNNLVLDGVELEADDLRMVKSCLERDFMPDAITSKGTFHFPNKNSVVLFKRNGLEFSVKSYGNGKYMSSLWQANAFGV